MKNQSLKKLTCVWTVCGPLGQGRLLTNSAGAQFIEMDFTVTGLPPIVTPISTINFQEFGEANGKISIRTILRGVLASKTAALALLAQLLATDKTPENDFASFLKSAGLDFLRPAAS